MVFSDDTYLAGYDCGFYKFSAGWTSLGDIPEFLMGVEDGIADRTLKLSSWPWPPLHIFGRTIPKEDLYKMEIGMIIGKSYEDLSNQEIYFDPFMEREPEGQGGWFRCNRLKEDLNDDFTRWAVMWKPVDNFTQI